MCCLRFRCQVCGFQRFVFTHQCSIKQTRHGAACAKCGKAVTLESCFNHAPVKVVPDSYKKCTTE